MGLREVLGMAYENLCPTNARDKKEMHECRTNRRCADDTANLSAAGILAKQILLYSLLHAMLYVPLVQS